MSQTEQQQINLKLNILLDLNHLFLKKKKLKSSISAHFEKQTTF